MKLNKLAHGLLCLVASSNYSYASVATETLVDQMLPTIAQAEQNAVQSSGNTLAALATGYLLHQQSNGSWLEYQQADGSWTVLNYSDTARTSWQPSYHLKMLRTMAAYFINATPSEQASSEFLAIKAGILQGIDYWYQVNPVSDNWWHNEIGKQNLFGDIAIMMHDHLSTAQLNNIIADMPSQLKYTGANRLDISVGVIYGGLLGGDDNDVTLGINGIKEVLPITSGEGIQADYSFQQHGAQLYNGGYGKVFSGPALNWAKLTQNSPWQFSDEEINIITSYFLDGDRWMTRGYIMDPNTKGRGLTRDYNPSATGLLSQMDSLMALSPARSAEITAFKTHIEGGPAGLNGFKHFWRSDYSVNMRDSYQFTVKMGSTDVETTETGNDENLLGIWLGFGNTFLRMNGDEYKGVYPVWDWRYIPGVTSPAFAGPSAKWGDFLNQKTFVGGVSNGEYGISVMDFAYMDTQAKKSWFHFADEIVALGAGISSSQTLPVSTTINQVPIGSDVTIDGNLFAAGEQQISNAKWIHHDKVGYVFPTDWSGVIANKTQTGSWQKINASKSADVINTDVFTVRVDHGVQPTDDSYQYILLPNKTAAETQNYEANQPITVLDNTSQLQAVYHQGLNLTAIVFHQAGSLALTSGNTISVNQPSTVLVDESSTPMKISIATPGVGGSQVKVCLTDLNENTLVDTFTFSDDIHALGKSITRAFNGEAGYCSAKIEQTLVPNKDSYTRGGSYADDNYGNHAFIAIKEQFSADLTRKGYMQWQLSGANLPMATHAELALHVNSVSQTPSHLYVHRSADDWQQDTITANNSPAQQDLLTSVEVTAANNWITLDLTDEVNHALASDGTMSLVLSAAELDNYIGLASSENLEKQPKLTLSYEPILVSQDSFIRGDSYANDNYGADTTLIVKDAPSESYQRKALLQWDLSAYNLAPLNHAEISLYVNSVSTSQAQLTITDIASAWSEQNITWNNAELAGTVIAQQSVSGGSWFTVDITTALNNALLDDGKLSLLLTTDTTGSYINISSKESINPAHLNLQY